MATTLMPEEAEKTPPSPLEKEYQAIEQQYRRDVAVLEARPFLRRAFFVAWTVLDIALIAFFLLVVPSYLVSGSFMDVRSTAFLAVNALNNHAISLANAPEPLEIGSARALASGSGAYDFFASLENPNPNWYATFTYAFTYDGGESERRSGFILPGGQVLATSLKTDVGSVPRALRLALDDVSWRRVSRHEIPNLAAWLNEHQTFPVSEITYSNNIGFDGTAIGQTDFTITNRTAYGYWEPKFLVTLERSGSIVALTEITLKEFSSGDTETVNLRWFEALPASATVKVIPVINYFDQSLYMEPEE